MALSAKFVVYNTQSGYDNLTDKSQDTFYYIRESRRIYRADELYSGVIEVDILPDENIVPLAFYLVNNSDLYLRSSDDWIGLSGSSSTNELEGITLNDKTIGGIKELIDTDEVLKIPENWQYNVRNSLTCKGTIYNKGTITII